MPGTETMLTKPVEKQHTDTVVNFLIRIACQVTLVVHTKFLFFLLLFFKMSYKAKHVLIRVQ